MANCPSNPSFKMTCLTIRLLFAVMVGLYFKSSLTLVHLVEKKQHPSRKHELNLEHFRHAGSKTLPSKVGTKEGSRPITKNIEKSIVGSDINGTNEIVQSVETNNKKCGGKQYLFFYAVNGFANQLEGIRRAMIIASWSNRTLIMPPLLPHKFSVESRHFIGRDRYAQDMGLDLESFTEVNNLAIKDVETTTSIKNRNEFPSWSEILDFDVIRKKTGVPLVDLFDFVHSNSKECVNEFYNQPKMMSINAIANISESSHDFTDLFCQNFKHHSIALIGNAFVFFFLEHMSRSDTNAQRIVDSVRAFTPSKKTMKLIAAGLTHLPNDFVSIHVRNADGVKLICNDTSVLKEYQKLIQSLEQANVINGSTIYIGSNDANAKRCLDEITHYAYNSFDISLLLKKDSATSRQQIQHAMANMNLDATTKHMLLDLLLISMGSRIFFAKINFSIDSSTFQRLIKTQNTQRDKLLTQLSEFEARHFV